MAMRPDQTERAEQLLARANTAVVEAVALEADNGRLAEDNAELTKTLEDVLREAKEGLVPIPKPGEPWDAKANYTVGDTATDVVRPESAEGSVGSEPAGKEGALVLYEATHYSRGKRPSEWPTRWKLVEKPVIAYDIVWLEFPEGQSVPNGKRVLFEDQVWLLVGGPVIRVNMNRPRVGNAKWELVMG